jgi:hypothetical protein
MTQRKYSREIYFAVERALDGFKKVGRRGRIGSSCGGGSAWVGLDERGAGTRTHISLEMNAYVHMHTKGRERKK